MTITLPSKVYDRLNAEDNLPDYFQEIALEEAEKIFKADDGDF